MGCGAAAVGRPDAIGSTAVDAGSESECAASLVVTRGTVTFGATSRTWGRGGSVAGGGEDREDVPARGTRTSVCSGAGVADSGSILPPVGAIFSVAESADPVLDVGTGVLTGTAGCDSVSVPSAGF